MVKIEKFNTFFAIIGKKNEHNICTHEGSNFRNYLTDDIKCNFAFHLTPERPMGHICPMFFSYICYMNITKKLF